jgi:hypothetical protein
MRQFFCHPTAVRGRVPGPNHSDAWLRQAIHIPPNVEHHRRIVDLVVRNFQRLVDQILSTGGAVVSAFPLRLRRAQNFPMATASSAEFDWSLRGRSRGIRRHAPHFALCSGAESRGFRRAGKCHQQKFRGGRTGLLNSGRSWWRPRRTCGRNSLRMCDLHWLQQ